MAEKAYRIALIVKSNQSPDAQNIKGIFDILTAAKGITVTLGPDFTVTGASCAEVFLKPTSVDS